MTREAPLFTTCLKALCGCLTLPVFGQNMDRTPPLFFFPLSGSGFRIGIEKHLLTVVTAMTSLRSSYLIWATALRMSYRYLIHGSTSAPNLPPGLVVV